MMWLRRVLALILALVFILLFIPLLLVFRVNATAANPHFYINQLRDNDIYNFAYDDFLPAAVDQAWSDANAPQDLKSLIEPRVVPFAEQALPRVWVQAQIEQVIGEVSPYFLGDTRSFRIDVPLHERTTTLAEAVKSQLNDEEFFSELYDRGLNYILDKNKSHIQDLPFTSEQLRSAAEKALPPEWIASQLSQAIDAVIPYINGDSESFTVHLEVTERLDDLEAAVVDLLGSQEAYNYVFDKLLAPTAEQYVSDIVDLPVDTVLTVDEIIGATRAVFTPEWYRGEVADIAGQAFAYLKGNSQNLQLSIPLAERKPAIISQLDSLVTQKLGRDVSSLVLPVITDHINSWIPDRWSLNEVLDQVTKNIDIEEEIGKVRDDINKGVNYTAANLRADLKDDFKTVEDVREKISAGYVYTDQDFHDDISDADFRDFDNARSAFGTVRRWMWVAWLIPALLLVGIGALGARKWTNKLIWGASVLAFVSIIVIVLSGPVFSAVAKPEINSALVGAFDQTSGLEKLITDKVVSLSQNTINAAVRGLEIQGIILLVVSLAVIAFAIIWNRYKAGAGPVEQPPAD